MSTRTYTRITLILVAIIIPTLSYAHVRWFAEEKTILPAYNITDIPVLMGIIGAVIVVLIGIYLDKKLHVPTLISKHIEAWAPKALSIASIGFGLSFIIFALSGFIFAPNLPASGELGIYMLGIELIAGIMIFLGLYERIGGLLIVVLFLCGCNIYGTYEMLDTLEMLGFALYALIVGRPVWKITDTHLFQYPAHTLHSYGLPVLRIFTGLNLVILGFTEKILTPSLTADFLTKYDWNFMHKLGFEGFTNYWFGFSAGLGEMLFGVFFILGLITRTTTLVLAVFLITTLILLGPVELIGHLPHFSIAIVFLVLGAGSRFTLYKKHSM